MTADEPPAGYLIPVNADALPTVSSGDGVYIFDTAGKQYLDGCSGAVTANLGHGNSTVANAMFRQASTIAFAHRSQFQNEAAMNLAAEIGRIAPRGLRASLFAGSGSEATELAVRAAALFDASRADDARWRLLSRRSSYHGSTIGSMSLSGHPGRRKHSPRLLHDFAALPAPDTYRGAASDLVAELRRAILAAEPRSVLAIVTETVVGAAAGVLVPPAGYYEELRALCDEFGILWIADEVMSGFGRTGRWFAIEHWNAVPDIIAFGKGAGGGYLPLSGILLSEKVTDGLVAERGYAQLGHTFSNSPVQAAVGLATVQEMHRTGAIANADRMGKLLGAGLAEVMDDFPIVGDVRGVGLMWGLEVVADRESQRPFAASETVTSRLIAACREAGLLVYPASGWLPEAHGDAILIAPPLIIEESELDDLIARLRVGLSTLSGQLEQARAAESWPPLRTVGV